MNYDLIERTTTFAINIRIFIKSLKIYISNADDIKQLIRSSGSVAANFIEANESISKNDFVYRIQICRKESKESTLWLTIIKNSAEESEIIDQLLDESKQLTRIFGAMLKKYNLTTWKHL